MVLWLTCPSLRLLAWALAWALAWVQAQRSALPHAPPLWIRIAKKT